MQQYSSLPEQNPQVDATPTVLTTIQQLRAELWLERSLNRLQNRLNDCLVNLTSNQPTGAGEAEIFQTVVNELNSILNNSKVAIALVEPQQTVGKVCFIPTSPPQNLPSLVLKGMVKKKKKFRLRLAEEIDIDDLQLLEQQEPPSAWQLATDIDGVIGWLIIIRTPVESDGNSFKDTCVQITSRLLTRAAQQCVTTITQFRKIQSLQQHCQQLETINQELERTHQLKNQFLANTSHEIRTPLSSITGFIHLLLAQGYDPSKERHQEYLSIIQSSSKHLLALINDILDLSKIEANQLEIQWEKVDLQTLCHNVLILVKEKAANKGLKLSLELDPNVNTLLADSLRLKQMLLNLLFNALKFTTNGTVGLQVKSNNSWIYFTVWDTGTGISKKHQAELFQPYFQIPNSVVSQNEGTGLGLVVTRKLAELHGGSVEVESELGGGSRFTIVLPLRQEEGESGELGEVEGVGEDAKGEDRSRPSQLVSINNHSTNILLVEDDSHNAQLMQVYLERLGYQVNLANNSQQIWKILDQHKPAVILLDIKLPNENGLAIVRQLREHEQYRSIPIIVQTAMAMKGDREICLAAGVNEYISKPIDLPLLGNLVAKYTKPTT
ncbi:hybrid histidine kinase/response regulator HrmK [Fischerella thermalis]|uniref:hybrid histidine kinase/response regulator HrmK n=1 Tax=Fischerella thermalis TaxID=372787 RepID=UPI0019E7C64E|nr:hybrid histidine kinase/response regulator HrmK [Fischerella thermalis]MBF1988721.1 response regulator [Fischerella thermalis M58_A2018_009]MBF2058922.1 response regulator [Fischerella thermalis M66_A2018_004]MBF2069202.1 response regulator [Fischerella thermalis M48_A2018_028]